ncbi:MAG: BlaI/MecI/CopY family transcriptional regulator [Thaumarchaeota archaeon]|nr:BlaI/MecI/CopY family transcriptional regulator [Nitrososphaerota archaeon]
MQRKVKIELQDEDGTKYTLALEGSLSRDKVLKIMDLMELMDLPVDQSYAKSPDKNTFFGKVLGLIEASFNAGQFSSSDVAREFEELHGQPVRLSTISTYLFRLVDKKYLRRERFGNSWVYRKAYLKVGQVSEK